MPLLELHNVVKYFPVRKGFLGKAKEFVRAVDGVSFSIAKGESFGLVGESGCGKSTLGRVILGLYKPTSGRVVFEGKMQTIFQDPFSSLNPRMSVGDIISEPLVIHGGLSKKELREQTANLLESVGLEANFIHRYPHEFSGGQRQRISIARAIALKPELIVADEPVSSLDVSVQADILSLLKDLRNKHGIAYLFISHDLRIVSSLCSRIAVMYLGKLVELLPAKEILSALHPYTKALVRAVPVANPAMRHKRSELKGDVPSAIAPLKGCSFCPRCAYKEGVCENVEPVLKDLGDGHPVACHFVDKVRRDT